MNAQNKKAASKAAGARGSPATESPAVSKIAEKALAELARWEEEKPRKDRDEKLFYCPVCSYTATVTYYMLKKYGKPKCPACDVEMAEFDEVKFRELRRRLAEEGRKILPRAVEALMEVAKVHGVVGGEPEVKVEGPVVAVRPDHTPNEFRYNASKRRLEAFYYYYDMVEHERSLKALAAAARRLGLGLYAAIYPDHAKMPMPLPYSYDAFKGLVIEMDANELCEYMMATSYWL